MSKIEDQYLDRLAGNDARDDRDLEELLAEVESVDEYDQNQQL